MCIRNKEPKSQMTQLFEQAWNGHPGFGYWISQQFTVWVFAASFTCLDVWHSCAFQLVRPVASNLSQLVNLPCKSHSPKQTLRGDIIQLYLIWFNCQVSDHFLWYIGDLLLPPVEMDFAPLRKDWTVQPTESHQHGVVLCQGSASRVPGHGSPFRVGSCDATRWWSSTPPCWRPFGLLGIPEAVKPYLAGGFPLVGIIPNVQVWNQWNHCH